MKLGYLGPIGTFSYELATTFKDYELKEYRTIKDIVIGLDNNEIDKAIVPIENSIQGGVTETIDTLIEIDNIYIEKELVLGINQNLIAGKKYKLDEIQEVYSHPQALAQCRNYIESNLVNASVIQVSSTALAAKEIKEKEYSACISSISCKDIYDLEVIGESIQDNKNNKTKFWLLSKIENKAGNKMAIIFRTKDGPGELYKVLEKFYKNNINLVKIESRPAKTELGSYMFLVELEFNNLTYETLDQIKAECDYFKILGRY